MAKKKFYKATEIIAGEIDFLSAVKNPAIEKNWLFKKNIDGKKQAKLVLGTKIIKSSDYIQKCIEEINVPENHHIVVGVAYKAMEEDAHGDFAREETVTQLMKSFIENGQGSDIEHNEEVEKDIKIVKNWQIEKDILTTDFSGKEELITKGSWLAAAIIKDGEAWEKIEKNEINGWSIGGVGIFNEEEINIEDITILEKAISIVKKAIGKEKKVEKGILVDKFNSQQAMERISDLWWTLDEVRWQGNLEEFKEALKEFMALVDEISTKVDDGELIMKAIQKRKGDGEVTEITENQVKELIKSEIDPIKKENENLKKQLEEVNKLEKSNNEKGKIKEYTEFAILKGFEIEEEGEYSAAELAKSICDGLHFDIEGASDETIEYILKNEIKKNKESKVAKTLKNSKGSEGCGYISEIIKGDN